MPERQSSSASGPNVQRKICRLPAVPQVVQQAVTNDTPIRKKSMNTRPMVENPVIVRISPVSPKKIRTGWKLLRRKPKHVPAGRESRSRSPY